MIDDPVAHYIYTKHPKRHFHDFPSDEISHTTSMFNSLTLHNHVSLQRLAPRYNRPSSSTHVTRGLQECNRSHQNCEFVQFYWRGHMR